MNFIKINVPNPYSPAYRGIREYDKDLAKVLENLFSNLVGIFNAGIRFDQNADVRIVSYTSNAVPNTEDAVAHTLKRVPIGYILIGQDKAASFYKGSTSWTTSSIYLKSSVASVAVTVLVI